MTNEKAALRRLIRQRFPGEGERVRQSEAICAAVLKSRWYREARVVGAYIPMAQEADIMAVMRDVLTSGRMLALPLCGQAPHMTLRRVRTLEALLPGAYGIPEPSQNAEEIPVESVDLLLTPLEGIDPSGTRLGKGGGYYDCLLAGKHVRTMGCALAHQLVEYVPLDAWDRPLAACADETGVHYFINVHFKR